MKGKTHDLNHNLTFFAHTINLLCHSISLMFRVLGIYNFGVLEKGRKETLSYSFLVKLQTKYFQGIYCIISLVTGLSDNVWKIILNFLLYDVKIANWRHRPFNLVSHINLKKSRENYLKLRFRIALSEVASLLLK